MAKAKKKKRKRTAQIMNTKNRALDKLLPALKPGKRISASGNIYYEYRSNRSDRNKKTRL